jgi:hypothetical protein
MVSREWEISTSCYPYSNDLYVWDGRAQYFAGYDDACNCGCRVIRSEPDGDTDGEGGIVNCTTYWCARCGDEVSRDFVWETASREELMRAIAEALFPARPEIDQAPDMMTLAKEDDRYTEEAQ